MPFCPNCGAQIGPDVKFCTSCGAPLSNGPQQQNNQYQQQNNQYQQNYGAQNGQFNSYQAGPAKPVSFGQKNIAVAIILSIVTCGIYSIIWLINMVDQINEASDNPSATPGGTVFLLSIVTCGIYLYYWLYKAGGQVNSAKERRGIPADSSSGIIYLVLAIFGLSIVSYALIQSELNKIAEYHGAPKP
ncbi:MAG: DUF4234 domain-containing protein [Clostridia bacterium]|nr:DUF4234 domain-containing protein [Clostridia bacterium]